MKRSLLYILIIGFFFSCGVKKDYTKTKVDSIATTKIVSKLDSVGSKKLTTDNKQALVTKKDSNNYERKTVMEFDTTASGKPVLKKVTSYERGSRVNTTSEDTKSKQEVLTQDSKVKESKTEDSKVELDKKVVEDKKIKSGTFGDYLLVSIGVGFLVFLFYQRFKMFVK